MYQGEVTVSDEDHGKFLDVIQDLMITGLTNEELLPHNKNEDPHKIIDEEQVQINSIQLLSKKNSSHIII